MGGCTALGIGLLLVARLGRTLQYVLALTVHSKINILYLSNNSTGTICSKHAATATGFLSSGLDYAGPMTALSSLWLDDGDLMIIGFDRLR
jgi:CHAT domain-containing protein